MTTRGFRWLVLLCAAAAGVIAPLAAILTGGQAPGAWRPTGTELTLLGLGAAGAVAGLMIWVRHGKGLPWWD